MVEVDQIHLLPGQFRYEVVRPGRVEVDDALVAAVPVDPGAAGHDVGVQVDRVDRVRDGDLRPGAEQFLDVAGVALGAVADEHLVGLDESPARPEIVGGDGLAQEVVALLRAVTAEPGHGAHLVHSLVEGLDACRRQRVGDIADAQLDHLALGVGGLEGGHPLGDVGEQVGGLELEIVFVHLQHGGIL